MPTTIIALTLFWEAGGSPADLRHVASVVHNRMYDDDAVNVCLAPRAFSCWNRRGHTRREIGRYAEQCASADGELWFRCVGIASQIVEGEWDATTTATHYWRHDARAVTKAMMDMVEVKRTSAHTYRRERR